MTDSLMKQLVFDCAMELLYGQEGLSNEEIGAKLLTIISSHDMNELDVDEIVDSKIRSENMKPIIGTILKEVETNHLYEIISHQGYMNYDVGIERVDIDNPDTEYIKSSDIGDIYELIDTEGDDS